ncbi:MAG: DUF503 domain-containing protein [Myxococcota bacterium]
MFVVAVARLGFDTSFATSLKEKRSVKQSIIKKVTNRFQVAIAEIEQNDNLAIMVLGISVVSNNARHGLSIIDKIISYIEKLYLAPLEYWEREIINLGQLEDPFWTIKREEQTIDWEVVKNSTSKSNNNLISQLNKEGNRE